MQGSAPLLLTITELLNRFFDPWKNLKINTSPRCTFNWLTNSGMLTVTNVSFLSSQPSHDVSGSKIYVLFGMNVTTLWSLVQLSTSFDLSSLIWKSVQNISHIIIIPMMIFYLLQKYKSTSVITEPAYFLLAQSGQLNFFLVGGNSNLYRSKIRQIV